MPDVWVNLAHAYLVQGDFVPAIKLYQVVVGARRAALLGSTRDRSASPPLPCFRPVTTRVSRRLPGRAVLLPGNIR